MRLKCIRRKRDPADNRVGLEEYRRPDRNEYDLIIGREYIPMGLGFWDGQVFAEIATEGDFMLSVPLLEFELVSARPSALWAARIGEDAAFRMWPPSFYARDYHSKLADRVPDVVADFERVRAELEDEDHSPLKLER